MFNNSIYKYHLVDRLVNRKVELASGRGRTSGYFIKSITPIQTEHAKHRQMNTCAKACRTIQIKRFI